MKKNMNESIKTGTEIGILASELEPIYQAYILNSINNFLFAQKTQNSKLKNKNRMEDTENEK
ncbi:TPA: hypothetical protein ACGFEM_002028 [Clostridioides difficile]|uniref:hypothetical protein n=1 Tax=Clostridioides difficile TaxID=1496 RepID=UPI00038CAA28|nr:hypothetical protein [Clostridioides difficile]AXU54388.1 hypothetical protein CDIF29637_02662 [Clostridioides difficile]EGT3735780.1 hypothetical protein [Clostridioides difficile]EGT3788317.1 hypothetical protein [Clostridioides difficile]EGT4734451.1 hypothetical protein [Clostridioides difficile]EGT4842077.1 hypothetical protein [Clostridioides difficile]